MMKPIIFLVALFVLTLMSNINQQSNAKTSAVGYYKCHIAMPADNNKATLYQGEAADNDTSIKDRESCTEPQKSSPALQTCLSGKCVNNGFIVL